VSRDGESGFTVAVDDWQGLARAANRLWHDRELRGRLGRQARERATRDFNADQMARRTVEVYRAVLNGQVTAASPAQSTVTDFESPVLQS
jgi:glycosyltransferase involved in cell wall biosynthesis